MSQLWDCHQAIDATARNWHPTIYLELIYGLSIHSNALQSSKTCKSQYERFTHDFSVSFLFKSQQLTAFIRTIFVSLLDRLQILVELIKQIFLLSLGLELNWKLEQDFERREVGNGDEKKTSFFINVSRSRRKKIFSTTFSHSSKRTKRA